jgi:hypothetical protein
MKNILNDLILRLKSEKGGYCRITHKEGWRGFLKDGDLVFKPHELHQALRQMIGSDGMRPRGSKLFLLRRRYNFTVTGEKKPYRTEEALERFVTASNPDKFYNQIPIGGGKESIDIGIEENDTRFVFVELKSWLSSNSPLYAIVESLKNLIEYRAIHRDKIKHDENCKHYEEVDLIVLAPESYYQKYGLKDDSGLPREDKIIFVKKALSDLSSEFNTNIAFMVLNISKEDINIQCQSLKPNEQNIVELSEINSIHQLARDEWKLLVSSGKK